MSPTKHLLHLASAALFALPLALGGCGDDKMQDPSGSTSDGGTTSDGMTSTSTTGDATTSTGTTSGTTGDTTGETGCTFLDCTTTGPDTNQCDIWNPNDCPEGEKCMPWANDGSNAWNATKCSPLDMNPKGLGDECNGGGVSGVDNCDKGSMCYYVDPETNLGVCVPFCVGSAEDPSCKSLDEQCSVSNNGVLILCRRKCNPLLQDCEGNAACLPAAGSDQFVCIVDASGDTGAAGDPCMYLNACDPGLFCAGADFIPECQATGCCTEFCDLSDPNKDATCSLADKGVTCQPYYEPGNEPPGLENVGACILPP